MQPGGEDPSRDECILSCVEYYYVCGEKRRNHLCVAFKVFKDVLKRVGDVVKALSSFENALAELEKQVASLAGEDQKELVDLIRKTRQSLTSSAKCFAAVASGNVVGLKDCLGAVCHGLELHNKVVSFASRRGHDLGDPIEEARCICAMTSVAKLGFPAGAGTISDAVKAAEDMRDCLCQLKFAPVSGGGEGGGGMRFVPQGGRGGAATSFRILIRCD